jgi:hypothetical protein
MMTVSRMMAPSAIGSMISAVFLSPQAATQNCRLPDGRPAKKNE